MAGRGSENSGEIARPELGGGRAKEEAELTVVHPLERVRDRGKGSDHFSTADSSQPVLPELVLLAVRRPVLSWFGEKENSFQPVEVEMNVLLGLRRWTHHLRAAALLTAEDGVLRRHERG